MTTQPPLESWREITETVLPFLKGFLLSKVSGGLRVLAAGVQLHLAGDAGDPPVARQGDGVVCLYAVVASGSVVAIYASPKNGSASTWTAIASGAAPPINGVTVGSSITMAGGSTKVTCA